MANSQWLRLYTSILDNPKIQRLSDERFKSLINLWCVFKENGGRFPSVHDIAWRLRCKPAKVQVWLDFLIGARLIDVDANGAPMQPHDWHEHQFQSDISTERVQRWRNKQPQRSETVSGTLPETHQSRTEQNRTDTEQIGTLRGNVRGKNRATEKTTGPLEIAIYETAQELHDRHPAIRRCGISQIRDHLQAIVRRLPAPEKIPTLKKINANHAACCESEGWQKDGGQYAKGLDNWLAPTKGRFNEKPPDLFENSRQSNVPDWETPDYVKGESG